MRTKARTVIAAVAGAGLAFVAGAGADGSWIWAQGTPTAQIGVQSADPTTLVIDAGNIHASAGGDINIGAGHLRVGGVDGNFELEHGAQAPTSSLDAYFIGSATRTPITIGTADRQSVTSLVVTGTQNQANDLQQWTTGDGTVSVAVDGRGRLRLGKLTLALKLVGGRAQLVAILPDGSQQVLALG